MASKLEKQSTIVPLKTNNQATKEEFLSILKLVSPGTSLRLAIEGIQEAKKGGIIVIENDHVPSLLDGGFKINTKFTAQKLVELAKMDGALILSKDIKRITHANVTLITDSKIQTKETGTRHKAAERTSKKTGTLVIAISERKNEINLYYKDIKYHLRDKSEILRHATDTLQILEKQRELFDANIVRLDKLEVENENSLHQACRAIQRGNIIQKMIGVQETTLIELGNESPIIKMRIKDLIKDVEKETDMIIRDYTKLNLKKSRSILSTLSFDELNNLENIFTSLGYTENKDREQIKGFRLLSKTSLSEEDISVLLGTFKTLSDLNKLEPKSIENVVGKEKANNLIKELNKIRNS